MEKRVAVIGIVVEKEESAETVNAILHEYRDVIVGRMGIPYRERKIHVISIAMDAPQDTINALTGKIGRLEGKEEGKVEGKAEGKAEGILEGKMQVYRNLLKKGFTEKEAREITEIS